MLCERRRTRLSGSSRSVMSPILRVTCVRIALGKTRSRRARTKVLIDKGGLGVKWEFKLKKYQFYEIVDASLLNKGTIIT